MTKLTSEEIEKLANKLMALDDASRAAAMVAVDVLHVRSQLGEEGKRDERREEEGSADKRTESTPSQL